MCANMRRACGFHVHHRLYASSRSPETSLGSSMSAIDVERNLKGALSIKYQARWSILNAMRCEIIGGDMQQSRIRRRGFAGGDHAIHVDAAQVEKTADGVIDQIVRARGAGGDADVQLAGREPAFRKHFFLFVQVEMQNRLVRKN